MTTEISNAILKEGINMGYKEAEVKDMWKCFSMFDQDGSNSIQPSETMAILQSIGQNPTSDDCDKIIQKTEKKGNQKITFLEFIRHAKDFIKDPATLREELKNAFLAFDTEQTGYLTQAELKDVLTSLGDRLNDDEINEMFMLVDIDKQGKINYNDFINQFVVEK